MTYNGDMFLASWFVKFLSFGIKLLHLGNGYTWPGHIVNKIYPAIWNLKNLKFKRGVVLISGTNGKTTTSSLIAHLLIHAGFAVAHNSSGANLANGVLTSILLNTNSFGKVDSDFGVFEVDEFNLPFLLDKLNPVYIILTNLSRDQLDRYGEVDVILDRWHEALGRYPLERNGMSLNLPVLLLPKQNELFKSLKEGWNAKGGTVVEFDENPRLLEFTRLVGKFNALNVNVAVEIARLNGLSPSQIRDGLQTFSPAFGRGEKISFRDKEFYVFLAKNPASFNNNLEALNSPDISYEGIIFILNDKIPDGRDVSWIYDINPVFLKEACDGKRVYVTGTRALDMQIRLNYADVKDVKILNYANRDSIKNLAAKKLVVLPNYSAMLELRKVLLGRNIL